MLNELTGKLDALAEEIAVIETIGDRLADDPTRRGESIILNRVVDNLRALHRAIETTGQEIYGPSEDSHGEEIGG